MDCIKNRAQRIERPIRVAQFGEGNFLRAFVDYMLDIANEKGVFDGNITIIKPIPFGSLERFDRQDCLYTVVLRGRADGKTVEDQRLITSVANTVSAPDDPDCLIRLGQLDTLRYIVSNTTEAGIALTGDEQFTDRPAASYPGKLTQLLYARYQYFDGAKDKGLTILPVELIEANGKKLRACVLTLAEKWNLGEGFVEWLNTACRFCSTLVDRIVTGYPGKDAAGICEKLGYEDELLDVGEPFGLWVVECDDPEKLAEELPLHKAGLPVIFTDNQKPYRERKVRILNGAHTSSVLAAYLAGEDIVRNMMKRPLTRAYVEQVVYEELLPTVPLPKDEVRAFAEAVMERFENPFIDHALLSISLNSVSKWRARCLPGLKDNVKANGKLPSCLSFSLAALIAFYTPAEKGDGCLTGMRNGEAYTIRDDQPILDFFWENKDVTFEKDFVSRLLAREDFWGENLNDIPGMTDRVADCLNLIKTEGMEKAIACATEGK